MYSSIQHSEIRGKVEKYEKLFRILPMDFDEVAKMLKDYAEDLPALATREERELYFMATRLNSNLWKRKV